MLEKLSVSVSRTRFQDLFKIPGAPVATNLFAQSLRRTDHGSNGVSA